MKRPAHQWHVRFEAEAEVRQWALKHGVHSQDDSRRVCVFCAYRNMCDAAARVGQDGQFKSNHRWKLGGNPDGRMDDRVVSY